MCVLIYLCLDEIVRITLGLARMVFGFCSNSDLICCNSICACLSKLIP